MVSGGIGVCLVLSHPTAQAPNHCSLVTQFKSSPGHVSTLPHPHITRTIPHSRGGHMCSVKSQRVTLLGFVGHLLSVAASSLCSVGDNM